MTQKTNLIAGLKVHSLEFAGNSAFPLTIYNTPFKGCIYHLVIG